MSTVSTAGGWGSLGGRIAVVTGSATGIGEGIAKVLAARGARVVVHGIPGQEGVAEEVVRSISATHGSERAVAVCADLLKAESAARALAEACRATWGRNADILVNNAGIQHTSPIERFEPAAFERVLFLNLTSNFYTIREFLPAMRAAGWGRIVNTASVHGLVGSVHKSAYVASKHGVVGMTKVVALENAGSGVTANCVCPGWVLTDLVLKQVRDRAARGGCSEDNDNATLLAEKQPSRQFATPDQIGAAVAFLCSDDAQQITGTTLTVDGGWTAQ
jgi:3-hydroxybutyrate dehydrogenase